MMEGNRQKEGNQSDDSATERKPSRRHVAAKLTMTRQRERRLQMQAGGKDLGSPRIDELHAERWRDMRREEIEMNAEVWKQRERMMLKKENIGHDYID